MSLIENRIHSFLKLGDFLQQYIEKNKEQTHNNLFFEEFKHQLKISEQNNPWFTKNNLLFSIKSWATSLTKASIEKWIFTKSKNIGRNQPKKVAIIMAGNIPLVGFHDFLSVLLTGHSVVIKQSSNDKYLLPFLAKYLEEVEPELKGKIEFTEEKLSDFDAVIATGSNNTARYFQYYFKNKPHIIRENRNSVAILTGNETEQNLKDLSNDIFQYFGLGCRNVSKIFVPKEYDFNLFFKGMYNQHSIINNKKYANNYDYNKAVYLMSKYNILENGFVIIKEDKSYCSPIASVFYEYYEDLSSLKEKLLEDKNKIQCIVAQNFIENEIAFGATQYPKLWDYADGINTIEFLSTI